MTFERVRGLTGERRGLGQAEKARAVVGSRARGSTDRSTKTPHLAPITRRSSVPSPRFRVGDASGQGGLRWSLGRAQGCVKRILGIEG